MGLSTLLFPLTTSQAPPPSNDLTCSLCKTVMELLDQFLTDTTEEEAIADALKQICALLPAPLDVECDAMIAEYTDDIIELLVNEYLSPQQVLTHLPCVHESMKGIWNDGGF